MNKGEKLSELDKIRMNLVWYPFYHKFDEEKWKKEIEE
jgi:hypothetical protein